MRDSVLITGASGMVGRELVTRYLSDTDCDLHLLLHGRGGSHSKASLLDDLLGTPAAAAAYARAHVHVGDVTQHDLGLGAEDSRALARSVTAVVHAAASTRFDLPLESARRVNVSGTGNVLSFAERCDRMERVAVLSTAYVAGKRTAFIRESDLEHDCGFVNTYEQSKYESELDIRTRFHSLPVVVYRLSTVLGDSRTGAVLNFTAPHRALQVLHLGLSAMVPGTPDYRMDFIPSDYTTRVLFTLFEQHFERDQVFHLTCPSQKSLTLSEFVDASFDLLARYDDEWRTRGYPKPAIVPVNVYELFLETAELAGNPLMRGVIAMVGTFAQQLGYPKTFDNATLMSCVPDYSTAMPHLSEYYPKVVEYCLRTRWGSAA